MELEHSPQPRSKGGPSNSPQTKELLRKISEKVKLGFLCFFCLREKKRAAQRVAPFSYVNTK
jgi:hypothetical protein